MKPAFTPPRIKPIATRDYAKKYDEGGEVEDSGDARDFPRTREIKPSINLDAPAINVPASNLPIGLRGIGWTSGLARRYGNDIPVGPGVQDVRRTPPPISTDVSLPMRMRIRGYQRGGRVRREKC